MSISIHNFRYYDEGAILLIHPPAIVKFIKEKGVDGEKRYSSENCEIICIRLF